MEKHKDIIKILAKIALFLFIVGIGWWYYNYFQDKAIPTISTEYNEADYRPVNEWDVNVPAALFK